MENPREDEFPSGDRDAKEIMRDYIGNERRQRNDEFYWHLNWAQDGFRIGPC